MGCRCSSWTNGAVVGSVLVRVNVRVRVRVRVRAKVQGPRSKVQGPRAKGQGPRKGEERRREERREGEGEGEGGVWRWGGEFGGGEVFSAACNAWCSFCFLFSTSFWAFSFRMALQVPIENKGSVLQDMRVRMRGVRC
jgi:hypothetical protein